ncbi:MAG: tetratricopeptide repeat protein [Patescibacteria group bacterium]
MLKKKKGFNISNIKIKNHKRFIIFILLALFLCVTPMIYFYFKQDNFQEKKSRGMESLSKGDFEEAIENFDQIKSKDEDVLFNLAVSHYNKKNYEKAEYFYEEILKQDPKNVLAYNGIGNMYRDKKNYEKARENYEKAISVKPNFIASYSNLAMMLLNNEKKEEASAVLEKGLENNADSSGSEKLKKLLMLIKN